MNKNDYYHEDVVIDKKRKKELVKQGKQLVDRFNELIKPVHEVPHEGGIYEAEVDK
jgi:hypothetical protein